MSNIFIDIMFLWVKLLGWIFLISSILYVLINHVAEVYECPVCEDCIPVVYIVSEANLNEGYLYTDIESVKLVKTAPDGTRYIDTGTRSVIVSKPSVFWIRGE